MKSSTRASGDEGSLHQQVGWSSKPATGKHYCGAGSLARDHHPTVGVVVEEGSLRPTVKHIDLCETMEKVGYEFLSS